MNLDIRLLNWQKKVWVDRTRFHVIAAGRRCGKTRFACWKLITKALEATSGSVFYVAPTQGQARDIMWHLLLEMAHPVIAKSHVNNMEVTLVNGIVIRLKGADRPETMRGVSLYYVVMDEYADIEPEVWEMILRPALADLKGEALFIGTPMGRNHFYELYQYGNGEDGDWKSWHFTSYDNETLDPKEIDAAKKSMSSYAFRTEFMATFEEQGSELFKEEWVKWGEKPKEGDYYIACDLAGFEEVGKSKSKNSKLDETAISVVKVTPEGDWFVENIIHGRWEVGETAAKIFNAVRDYQPVSVGIEKGIARQAVMSPLTDMMRKYGKYFHLEDLTHGNQKKVDRVVWSLQGRFENGRITLNRGPWNERLLDQLFQFPSTMVHDDLIDSLSYIDQLAKIPYGLSDFIHDEYVPCDLVSGY